ncbi:MAG: hypothetical protein AABW58_02545, partial [Nanoarchaeota archaeon]
DGTQGDGICCEPGKVYDLAQTKCIYDPNGIEVTLDLDANSLTPDYAEFAYKGELHTITFEGFFTDEDAIITVSSTPITQILELNNIRDFDLDSSTGNEFRIMLKKVLNPDPLTGKATFLYIISDRGLCDDGSSSTSTSGVSLKVEAEDSTITEKTTGGSFPIERYGFDGNTYIKNIEPDDKFTATFNVPRTGNYDITARAWRGITPDASLQVKKGTTNLGTITIPRTQSSGTGLIFGEFKINVNLIAGTQTLDFIAQAPSIQGGWGVFLLDWFKVSIPSTSSIISASGCTGNSQDSICNYGKAYCTLGTKCNWYPPNSEPSWKTSGGVIGEGGCCPENQKWNDRTKVCIDFADPSAKCLEFNKPFDFNVGDTIKYDNVCCQVSIAYGFWDPVTTYAQPTS